MPEEIVSCGYEIREGGDKRELVVKCRECEKDFSISECTPGIILAMQKEYKISSIILSDYVERQYVGRSLEMLKTFSDLCEELDRYTTRDEKKQECKGCNIAPKRIFPILKKTLLRDPGAIYEETVGLSKAVMTKDGCTSCRKATKEELSMLGIDLLKLKSKVLLDAYGIVG